MVKREDLGNRAALAFLCVCRAALCERSASCSHGFAGVLRPMSDSLPRVRESSGAISQRKLEANRRNAQRSTGPKTESTVVPAMSSSAWGRRIIPVRAIGMP